jgi:hypothetical protein
VFGNIFHKTDRPQFAAEGRDVRSGAVATRWHGVVEGIGKRSIYARETSCDQRKMKQRNVKL